MENPWVKNQWSAIVCQQKFLREQLATHASA
jgi:hypothetical protein